MVGNRKEPEQSFAPRIHSVEGATVEFSRRDAPEVDITVPDYLLCVNFNPIRNAVYAYNGAAERRGIRKVGFAHLIDVNHNSKAYTPDPTHHVVFDLKPQRLQSLTLTTFENDRFNLRTEGAPFFDSHIYQIARSVRDELCTDMPGGSIMIDSLTTMLEVHLLRQHSDLKQPRQQRTSLAPHKLAVITDYIQTHLDQTLRLSELANLANMSSFHFSRCFKHTTGLSPSRYILAKRVEFVQHELAHTDRPLLELSLAAGFSSQSHMTSVFKQAVGLSPGEFRTQYH